MRFWRFCKGFFLSEIREFEVIFWSIVFPILLYFFLSTIFGSEGNTTSINFNLAVARSGGQTTETVLADKTAALAITCRISFFTGIYSNPLQYHL